MNFGVGYWLKTLSPSAYVNDGLIEKEIYIQELQLGWNLLVNPHLCSYDIEDLRFEVLDDDYTFNQAVRDEFISRALYSYRTDAIGQSLEGSYELIEEIGPKEAE